MGAVENAVLILEGVFFREIAADKKSSALSAKREGFAGVGVDGLMKAIGLGGGAFYGHFSSKDELFSSIVERELSQSLVRLGGRVSPTGRNSSVA